MELGEVLVLVALGFALVSGINDGAAVLAAGLRVRGIPPWAGILALGTMVVAAPRVLGTAVATTLADDLVTFDGSSGRRALLVAVAVAVVVTTTLSRLGFPTSLTLALVGAITGAGLGGGFAVSWTTVGFVLLLGVVAPVVGLAGGWLLTVGFGAMRLHAPLRRTVRWAHVVGFGLQCVAYGANDGQKMLAVYAVAAGSVSGRVEVPTAPLLAIAVLFMVGTVVGLPTVGHRLSAAVVPLPPPAAVITELSSATVVLGSSALGAPVSMTQAISGAMVGTGLRKGAGRIRWQEVAMVGSAWVVTLPAALALSFGLALVWA